jgi:hypothetical protein
LHFPKKHLSIKKINSYNSNSLGGMLRGLEMTIPRGGELAWFRV